MKRLLLGGWVLAVLGVSCMKKESEICNYDPCLQAATAAEITQVESYLATNSITATKHCSGMYYRIDNAGTGKQPGICNQVVVRYKGQLTSGATFEEKTTAVVFNLGTLIEGWKKGIPLVKEGGKVYLYVPPSLAYGAQEVRDPNTNNLIIPANSMLIFEISLDQVI